MIEIDRSTLTKQLYAQDASMYEQEPEGVAFPRDQKDIQHLVRLAGKKGFSITARSAGTSLAGQTTGDGVIMDVSRYMTQILQTNPEGQWAEVEPGVIRDTLNRELEESGLLFGPDTATTNRCMIGGMIGNNSAGMYSIKYGTTREHILQIKAVLSDGSLAVFEPLTATELENKKSLKNLEGQIYRNMVTLLEEQRDLIERNYPHKEIIRRNTGYALDKLLEMEPFTPGGRPFNMAELLCGSEGTLALTVSTRLNLVPSPEYSRLLIPQFRSVEEAMEATVEIVRYRPAAVELVDDIILDATKGNPEQRNNRFFLNGEPACLLIVQMDGKDPEFLKSECRQIVSRLKQKNLGYSYPEIDDPKMMKRVWELRKAGLGLLMGLGREARTPAFIEDTSVRVKDLPAYVRDFRKILRKHDSSCVFYAHASVGELHFRPVIDTTSLEGVTRMRKMAEEVADLVRVYGGSLSGEHGDGRARTPFIERVLGKEMIPVLMEVKQIWDPEGIFNPGKITDPEPMDKDLRYPPGYEPARVETVFKWREEGGFGEAIERCNGAGVCRKLPESGGTMCPSYMATKSEKDSTRGRANIFRQVFTGDDPEGYSSQDLKEALDLCLSCKACKTECPASVDMSRMKAEFLNGWQQERGVTRQDEFFTNVANAYNLAGQFPGIANLIIRSYPGKALLRSLYGISTLRDMPVFARQSFRKWFNRHSSPASARKVLLFVDLFTNYHEPEVAKAAVEVLEKMGFQVIVPDLYELGRISISRGMLDKAQEQALKVVEGLIPFVSRNVPVIGLEPSEILTLRDEFLDLVDEEHLSQARLISSRAFSFEEFLVLHKDHLPDPLDTKKTVLHGHCHTRALTGDAPTRAALEAAGYEVEELDTGCCGMAGSFGYEADKYELSMEIGWQRLFPQLGDLEEDCNICAPGFSCRHQIYDGTGMNAQHPAVLIAKNLK